MPPLLAAIIAEPPAGCNCGYGRPMRMKEAQYQVLLSVGVIIAVGLLLLPPCSAVSLLPACNRNELLMKADGFSEPSGSCYSITSMREINVYLMGLVQLNIMCYNGANHRGYPQAFR
jgi:hypothetical protein